MKILISVFIFLLTNNILAAQDYDSGFSETDSLIVVEGDTMIYYYSSWQPHITASFEMSNNPDGYQESLSIEAGVIFKNRLILGLYATAPQAQISKILVFPNNFDLSYAHGGMSAGYRTDTKKLFDFRFTAKIGFGEMAWQRQNANEYFVSDRFMTINPAVGIDVNLSRYAKLISELGYRQIQNLDLVGVSSSDFSGITFRLGLSLGIFNYVEL